MKAIVYHEYGSPDVCELAEVDKPVIHDEQVLVRVHGAAVNPGDWFWLTGAPYVMRPAMGFLNPRDEVLGRAIAGQVEAVGDNVTKFQPGDEVYAEISGGGFAEYASVAQDSLSIKPANLTFEQAAAIPLVGITALEAIRDHGKVEPGQKVLINGASGGVGTFAVQIAKSFGAEVTGVCSSQNMGLVRSIGADHVIDYTREDFTSSGQRYDLILDNVGNRSLSELRQALTPTGTLIPNSASGGRWFGSLGRVLASVAMSPFVGQTLRPFVAKSRTEDLDTLRELVESETVTPVIDQTYPLSETADALAHYGAGHTRGKVVITV